MIARPDHEAQVVRALGSIGVATLASRVLGFVRDVVVARAFGAGPVTDAFFVAFRIPNILRRLLGEGALSTAVVPMLSDYLVSRPRADFQRLFRALLGAAILVLCAVSALGSLLAPWIVRLMAPGFAGEPGQLALTVMLTRLMFPYLVLVGLAALVMGALNAHGRFFTSALGPAVMNIGMVVSVLALTRHVDPPIVSLAVGVLVGGVGQLVVQVPDLVGADIPLRPSREVRHPALGRLLRLLVPSIFGLAAVQVTIFINTLLASLLRSGSISYLYYADRVMEFPLGVFGIALASAALPPMSRQAAAGDRLGLARTMNFALRLSCYTALPATVGLVLLLREPGAPRLVPAAPPGAPRRARAREEPGSHGAGVGRARRLVRRAPPALAPRDGALDGGRLARRGDRRRRARLLVHEPRARLARARRAVPLPAFEGGGP